MESKVSIIVPVYNSENFLTKCVNSILQQSYKNIELILVDDESPDKSGEICDRYAQEDHRVVTIHKSNGGTCEARNVGLDHATGKYLMFADGDDWMEKNWAVPAVSARVSYSPPWKLTSLASATYSRASPSSGSKRNGTPTPYYTSTSTPRNTTRPNDYTTCSNASSGDGKKPTKPGARASPTPGGSWKSLKRRTRKPGVAWSSSSTSTTNRYSTASTTRHCRKPSAKRSPPSTPC